MATGTSEPRALATALSSPVFVTRGGGGAMHAANRHVERWAPESPARRQGSMRSLGFVDRLVSPWLETAQRSASLRMFDQYRGGVAEREGAAVSWVFPRPWYQDELDWMAAARQASTVGAAARQAAPALLTTRGTFVPPAMPRIAPQQPASLPPALYEYVAPSLSIAGPQSQIGNAMGSLASERVFSTMVPFAAAQAAHVMSRAMGPLVADGGAARMSPGLRSVLATILARSAHAPGPTETRSAATAPQLVTPPSPRADDSPAAQIAADVAVQRARIVELQKVARQIADREMAQRAAATPAPAAQPAAQPQVARTAAAGDATAAASEQQRLEQRIAERLAERESAARTAQVQQQAVQAERQRRELEERIAQASARTQTARLHEQSREAAIRDARIAALAETSPQASAPVAPSAPAEPRVPAELAAALAALPPELAGYIGRRPDRAMHAINELGQALHAVELLARNSARGGSVESSRGPRVAMPAGLGGLVAMVDRAMPIEQLQAQIQGAGPRAMPSIGGGARMTASRVPAMQMLMGPGAASRSAMPTALGATAATTPAAIQHVAWADRWLARFAGARPHALDAMTLASASPERQLAALAEMAPGAVFVAPEQASDVKRDAVPTNDQGVVLRNVTKPAAVRFDDDEETPDSVFAAISQAASQARSVPSVAEPRQVTTPDVGISRETLADHVAHSSPHAPDAGLSAQLASSPFAPALRHLMPLAAAPTFDVRALFGGGLAASYLAGMISPETHELAVAPQLPAWATWSDARAQAITSASAGVDSTREIADWSATYVSPELPAEPASAADAAQTPGYDTAAALAPLTTLRSALLSFEVEQRAGSPAELRAGASSFSEQAVSPSSSLARSMIETMSLPMIGDATLGQPLVAPGGAEHPGTAFAAPGMIGDRAQSWSVAQERSSSDLALDFVSPELVLAARVYGLGPAEAAQAARLAISGPSQLAAMAGAIDRTFIQAMAIERDRASGVDRASGLAPRASARPESRSLARDFATVYPTPSEVVGAGTAPAAASDTFASFAPSQTSFGIERRAPRGAFLWPSGTVAALGMTAPTPDGDQSASVAALELLAAHSVAELGTFAAFGGERPAAMETQGTTGTPRTSTGTKEEDVIASVAAMVPESRRSKFEALYLALGQSPAGKSFTPAARAARALALAGRGEETISARERASIAWDVLPNIYAAPSDGEPGVAESASSVSTGAASAKASQRRQELREAGFVEMRPGLGALSSRAGEALGSYVAPITAANAEHLAQGASASSSSRDGGAASRAPTAAPELVRTGRASARYGGGEVEIPAWFESAARKMFADRGNGGGISEDISLAELTLVQAPPSQVAASTRSAPSAQPSPAVEGQRMAKEEHKIDIEKVANDVFKHVQTMMDSARARNGEPYL